MIRSMTGFGRGAYSDDARNVTVEIRSVNHRYRDISVRLPRKYSFAEEQIKSILKDRVYRGKIEINVTVDNLGRSDSAIRLDRGLAAGYYDALTELNDAFDYSLLDKGITLSLLARMPDVITVTPAAEDEDEITRCLTDAARKATDDIIRAREIEGESLAQDIAARADIISELVDSIETRAPEVGREYADKIKTRIEELLDGSVELPAERIAMEAAIFADKANITEEIVRLRSHVSQLRAYLTGREEPIGKKMDFLVQEMNREANTIGSKSNDAEITSMMLDLKAEIEKIREQVQNIE